MPFPLAHPAATLPFRPWCPRYLNFAALVVGSLVPDLAASMSDLEYFSHTILGSFVFCVPVGLLTLWIFRQVRIPLIAMLPNPHRDVLLSVQSIAPSSLSRTVVSLVFGSWLHIAWDALTHDHSWIVRHSILSSVIVGGVPLNHLVWLCSSVVGVAIPLGMYLALVRKRNKSATSISLAEPSEWRLYGFWFGVLMLPFAAAIPLTLHDPGYSGNNFVRYVAMYYMSCCYLTLAVTGFVLRHTQRRVSHDSFLT